jgi:glucan biosynthesis protein
MNDVDVSDMTDVENPDLLKPIEKTNELKEWLVDYVGNKMKPENDEVNVEMVIKTIAVEFPEFLLTVAEENFIRGYQQAMHDIDEGEKLMIKDGLL